MYIIIAQLVYILTRLILSNDVHPNPGPQFGSRTNNFTFGHLNARSLNNEDKLDEISVLIEDHNVDIFAVSETWLNSQIPQSAVAIPGYGSPLKPAAHERTCRAYLLFVTSWIDKISSCAGNIYGIFFIRDM